MKAFLGACCIVLLLAGCSVPRAIREGGPMPGQRVDPVGKVLILGVKDGQEQGQSPAQGSGQELVDSLRKVLAEHSVPLSTTPAQALPAGFDEAVSGGWNYVLKGEITHWEDNATAWSGKGDKLFISVELYDAKTKQLVAAATEQRTATGFTFVSGTPDRFMDEVSVGALSKIYGWPIAK
ncbi:DUF4823 domain-containing protein [Dyella agri]|uniref:DUF4823 domain-containing protein n=1 Tax=Dyella agri TaxID=1926869 RepID=A0ABW8KK99_9GAMM